MMLPTPYRRLSLDPYSFCAGLLLLVILLWASWFASRHWLELRIQHQLQELTIQGHQIIDAANKELILGSTQLHAITRTLASLSSMQHFLYPGHDNSAQNNPASNALALMADLEQFHAQFKLIGVWLLDAEGRVVGQSPLSAEPGTLTPKAIKSTPWSRLVFDLERQQAKQYYSLPLTPNSSLTLLVGNTMADISPHAYRIKLLVSGSSDIILLSDDRQWLGYAIPRARSHSNATNHPPSLPLQAAPLQPDIQLLGAKQTPVLFISQPSQQQDYQIHVLADASRIYHQVKIRNNLAALIAIILTASVWGALLTLLTFRRNRQHQQQMNQAHQELLRLNDQLKQLASTDALTLCPNRRAVDTQLRHELAQLQRYQHPFCVVMLDIDFFKRINDQHGHDIGDKVLTHFAATGRNAIRSTDMLARIGGEEFLLILPHTDSEQGHLLAQRLLDTVTASPLYLEDRSITFSFSGGLAQARATDDINQLVLRADQQLYLAKKQGRCRICSEAPRTAMHSVTGSA